MASDNDRSTKEYRGYVEIEGERIPLSIFAADAKEAYHSMLQQYGEDSVFSLWNEEDANTYR